VHYAYEAMQEWFASHPEYQPDGGSIERYIKGEEDVSSPEELETGILFPVRRA
jgi:effector-binding domain-containing protein